MHVHVFKFFQGIPMDLLPSVRVLTSVVIVAIVFGFNWTDGIAQNSKPGNRKAANAITEVDALEFAQSLFDAVIKGDIEQTNQLIWWDEILDRATLLPKLGELKESRGVFKKSVAQSLQKAGGLYSVVSDVVKKGGSYRYLRTNLKDKEPFVLFRLKYPQNGAINYHKLYLMRQPDGHVVACDMYVLVSAEKISETLHRSWLQHVTQVVGKKDNAMIAKFEANLKAESKISELFTEGKHAELLAEFRKSSEAVRKDKNMLIIRLTAAQKVSDAEYVQAMDDFQKAYPHDAAVDFMLIDGHIFRKDFEKAIGCVDRTIEQLGEDAALLAIRANMFLQMDKLSEAIHAIKDAMAAEPDLADPYVTALDIMIAAKDHDETSSLLTVLQQKFGYKWKDLREVPVFAEFVKTPQYEKWSESQKSK